LPNGAKSRGAAFTQRLAALLKRDAERRLAEYGCIVAVRSGGKCAHPHEPNRRMAAVLKRKFSA
jgi:hypothetical protein